MALTLLKRRVMQRIVLTRPAVEAGEALGFLPGDLREKVAPYLRPLYDAIHDMLDPEEGQRYLEEGTIEIAPLAFMRGRTLSRSFVILDEAQNTTREQMFMALTRLGDESRMVVTGDSSQVDLKPGVRSGLAEAEHALRRRRGHRVPAFHPSGHHPPPGGRPDRRGLRAPPRVSGPRLTPRASACAVGRFAFAASSSSSFGGSGTGAIGGTGGRQLDRRIGTPGGASGSITVGIAPPGGCSDRGHRGKWRTRGIDRRINLDIRSDSPAARPSRAFGSSSITDGT